MGDDVDERVADADDVDSGRALGTARRRYRTPGHATGVVGHEPPVRTATGAAIGRR